MPFMNDFENIEKTGAFARYERMLNFQKMPLLVIFYKGF